MTAIVLNLLVNATFSLFAGLLVVGLFLKFFRVRNDGWKLFLLGLPFWKILYDIVRGVPENSILRNGIDPFTLPPQHQALSLGAGLSWWGPSLTGLFTVSDLRGHRFAASIGDYASWYLVRHLGPVSVDVIVFGILALSFLLCGIRFAQILRFAWIRRRDRKNARSFREIRLGFRRVDVYISTTQTGSPFTGGFLRPYICLPAESFACLNAVEVEAVIAHELSHVRRFDLVGSLGVQAIGDFFWFVPGYRWLSRRIDRLREVLADAMAVRAGADPLHLASALVKLKEAEIAGAPFAASAFFRERSLLKERVERLIGDRSEKRPRFGWSFFVVRSLATAWAIGGVLLATLGGYFHLPG